MGRLLLLEALSASELLLILRFKSGSLTHQLQALTGVERRAVGTTSRCTYPYNRALQNSVCNNIAQSTQR